MTNYYYFSIAGVTLKLEADVSLSVSARFAPFLIAPKKEDYSIIVKCVDSLPPVPRGAMPRGSTRVLWQGEQELVYYKDRTGKKPGLLCCITEQQAVLSYLPEAAHTLSGVGAVFHRVPMESWLLRKGGLILHAALVDYKGKGILLCGRSGVGKSTQAALWKKLGGRILNGDRTVVREAVPWEAYGSPVAGTSGIYRNESVPVAAVALLSQGSTPAVKQVDGGTAILGLYPETAIHHWESRFVSRAIDLLAGLTCNAGIYELTCTKDIETPELLGKVAKL